jgi:uncharacterized protein (TIGR03083 family)
MDQESSHLSPLRVVDVDAILLPERAALLELLAGLDEDDWAAPTECPAWTVEGVALHVLGDDLSLLARQRDAAVQGLTLYGESHPGLSFRQLLDGFNEQWVTAARFLSPPLILTLLEATGRWTAAFYRDVNAKELGEPVGLFAGQKASPYWQIAAREYLERWTHQHQIRRATARSNLSREFLLPAAAIAVHVIAAHARALDVQPGTTIVFEITGVGEWTIEVGDTSSLVLVGAAAAPAVRLAVDEDVATPLLSRGLTASDVVSHLRSTGSDRVSRTLIEGFSVIVARDRGRT